MFTVQLKSGESYNIAQPIYCNDNNDFVVNYIGRKNNQPVNKTIEIDPLNIQKIY